MVLGHQLQNSVQKCLFDCSFRFFFGRLLFHFVFYLAELTSGEALEAGSADGIEVRPRPARVLPRMGGIDAGGTVLLSSAAARRREPGGSGGGLKSVSDSGGRSNAPSQYVGSSGSGQCHAVQWR
jgi:hypothetical protein|uniref:Uncharacterized protein n=1 Tax=Eutreptiella gymnastica TaxID=73025 RepID=A0A7S4CXP4_9EUGL